MKYNRGQVKLIRIKISILRFPIFPFLHHFSSSHSIYRSNRIPYTCWMNWMNPWYVYSIRNLLLIIIPWIISRDQEKSVQIKIPIPYLLFPISSSFHFFLHSFNLSFPFSLKLPQDRVNERETSLTMVDLPLLVISRATCGIRIEDEISFAWPADHVNSISTGYNGFSSCVYRFEGEHDEIVKLRFNKLLNGNRTCRSVSSPDFNRLLCVGSENFFVKVGLIVSFNPCWINFRLVRIRMEKSYAIIYLRRFRFIKIFFSYVLLYFANEF